MAGLYVASMNLGDFGRWHSCGFSSRKAKTSGSLAFGAGSTMFPIASGSPLQAYSVPVFSPVARTSRQAKRRRFSSWTRCRCFPSHSAFRLLGRSLTWPSIQIGPDRLPPHLRLGNTICLSALLWRGTPAGPRHARARLASPELLSIPSLQPRQGALCALRDLRQDHLGPGCPGRAPTAASAY